MLTIKNWPTTERPREKFFSHGPEHLSEGELLAILLNTGYRGKTSLDLAYELLNYFGGLRNLLEASPKEVCARPGMGLSKYAKLKAGLELSKRHLAEGLKEQCLLNCVDATKQYLLQQLRPEKREVFACLFLDIHLKLIHYEVLFYGDLSGAEVYTRQILLACLKHNAAALIIAHNHPSGNANPSEADKALTQQLQQALEPLDIRLVDHMVVGAGEVISFAEKGYL